MSKRRSESEYPSQDQGKKIKNLGKGLLLSEIPETLDIDIIKLNFHQFYTFLPLFQGKHLKIAYIIYENDTDIDQIEKILSNLCPGVNSLQFSPSKSFPLHLTIEKLGIIIKNFLIIDTNSLNFNLPQTEGSVNDPDFDILFDENNKICQQILAENYLFIRDSLESLKKTRERVNLNAHNSDNIIGLIIFSITWLCRYKINKDTLEEFSYFFAKFQPPYLVQYFRDLTTCHPILKLYSREVFWQLAFFQKPFNDEADILESVYDLVRVNLCYSLIDFCPPICNILKNILSTQIVQDEIENMTTYSQMIEEYISNIYLLKFPETLQGITLFNGSVIIKIHSGSQRELSNSIAYQGFIIMTALHEFGHFAIRYDLNSEMEWLNYETPRVSNSIEQEDQASREGGTVFMKAIFSYEPKGIEIPAIQYIMDESNWLVPLSDFQAGFAHVNKNIGKNQKKNGKLYNVRLKQLPRGESTYIRLGGCNRSQGSRNN